jgi:Trk-type K+ transport system membrane component
MCENGKEKLTYKQKLHEPILNPIQVIILALIMLFEVISNVIPILMGSNVNPYYVLLTITIGIVAYVMLSLLRAAYPEQVPDTRITTAFQVFIKQFIDALFTNKEEQSELKFMLERLMVWAVREWDVIYQMELADAIAYAKSRLQVKEPTKILE